jgi:dTDP-4-dehydrorhamnose 3,5-epimerase
LRGLHYQHEFSQAKLIHVISGILFDVALDLRTDSSPFGKYHVELMKAEDNKVLFIPEGFAHGFISLTDSIVRYKSSNYYFPEDQYGISFFSKEIQLKKILNFMGVEK